MVKVRETTRMHPLKNAPGVYIIEGKTGDWMTVVRGSSKTCTCPDYVYRRVDGSNCKHLDAVEVVLAAEARAYEILNIPKPSDDVLIREVVNHHEGADLDLHRRGQDLYCGDQKINNFQDLDRIKKDQGKKTKGAASGKA